MHSTPQRNPHSCSASAILYLVLSYRKSKLPTSQFLAAAAVLSCAALSLLLPGLALRFPELSNLRVSAGASDRAVTVLFAATTPIVIASRAKTILARLFALPSSSICNSFCNFHTYHSPAIFSRHILMFSYSSPQALLKPNAAQSYAVATYFLQARPLTSRLPFSLSNFST
jgi:hypothetical protein